MCDNRTFKKYDSGKPRVELIEPKFTLGLAKVLSFGAEKYGDDNWKNMEVEDLPRIIGAVQRHLLAYQDGEKIDPESHISHLSHATAGLMFLHYFDVEKS